MAKDKTPPVEPDRTEPTVEEPKGQPKTPPPKVDETISAANAAADRLEKANVVARSLLDERMADQVENTLGGEAAAGKQGQTPEEKANMEAKKYLAGTGFEDMFDPATPK